MLHVDLRREPLLFRTGDVESLPPDTFGKLPNELIIKIFSFIKSKERLGLSLVSHCFRRLCYDSTLIAEELEGCEIYLRSMGIELVRGYSTPLNLLRMNIFRMNVHVNIQPFDFLARHQIPDESLNPDLKCSGIIKAFLQNRWQSLFQRYFDEDKCVYLIEHFSEVSFQPALSALRSFPRFNQIRVIQLIESNLLKKITDDPYCCPKHISIDFKSDCSMETYCSYLDVIGASPMLESFEVCNYVINDARMSEMFRRLVVNQSLRGLTLNWYQVSPTGMEDLIKLFSEHSKLDELCLKGSSSSEIQRLFYGLKRTRLKKITLIRGYINADVAHSICTAMINNVTMELLDLSRLGMCVESRRLLTGALKNRVKLNDQ